jgi:WD40 repeat protein
MNARMRMSENRFLSRLGQRLRSKPQLSLLSLMFLIAAMALVSQFWLVPMLRQHAREALLKKIADVGGQWVDISAQPPQKRLLLSGQNVGDELLVEIATQSRALPELIQLDLFQTQVSDKGWEAVTSYSNQLKHMVIFENKISDKAIEATQSRRKDLKIERRVPDPVAASLAMAPIPPAAIISLISVENRILAGAGDGRLHVLDADGQRPRRVVSMHDNWLFDVALSPNRNLLASAGGDNMLAIWSYPEMELVTRLEAHSGDLHGVVWMDDSHLATISDDRSLSTWDLRLADQLKPAGDVEKQAAQLVRLQSHVAHEKAIPRIRISQDRHTLITASRDEKLIVWSVARDFAVEKTLVLKGHLDDCMDVQINPTGKLALSVGYDGALIAWDLRSGEIIKRNQISEGRLFCVEVDWNRQIAFAGTPSGVIQFDWNQGETKSLNDQPFVSRIFAKDNTVYTSDGFGGLIARNRQELIPQTKTTLFEEQYDHYSDDFFRPVRNSTSQAGTRVQLIRNAAQNAE